MHRDRQHRAASKAEPRHERSEWAGTVEQPHQTQALEHARQTGKQRRAHQVRSAEADRQIREIRARF
jgi:hypothetical protein